MGEPAQAFAWRRFAPQVLLPTTLFATATGTASPLLPVVAVALGAGLAEAGFVGGVLVVAFLAGNLPAGALIHRLGERRAMYAAAAVSLTGLTVCLTARAPVALAVGAALCGFAEPTYHIARQALVTVVVPVTHRARILSVQAGALRLGVLCGPLIAGAVIGLTGSVRAVYPAAMVLVGLGVLALRWLPDPDDFVGGGLDTGFHEHGTGAEPPARASIVATVIANRRVLSRLGPIVMLIMAVRQGRNAVIPLWGVSVGMDAEHIALVLGAGAAVDFALSYPGGLVMDRYGRIWSGVPALLLFAAGFGVVAVTGFTGSESVAWCTAGALVLGAANGISSGIIATIGSDVVGDAYPATFLSVWQLTSNLGGAAAPFVVSAVTAAASLAAAAALIGALSLAGAALTAVVFLRYLPTATLVRSPTRSPVDRAPRSSPGADLPVEAR